MKFIELYRRRIAFKLDFKEGNEDKVVVEETVGGMAGRDIT